MAGLTRHPPTYFPSLLRVALGIHRVRFVSHWHALRVGVAVMARQLSCIGAMFVTAAMSCGSNGPPALLHRGNISVHRRLQFAPRGWA